VARRFSGRQKKIDEVSWHGVIGIGAAITSGTPAAINLISAQLTAFTVMRTRGQLSAYFNGPLASTGQKVQIAMGIHLVPEGTGTTVLQSPIADPNANWFVYETFVLAYEEYVVDVIAEQVVSGFRKEIDGKAMRRIHSDTEVQVVFENATIETAAPVNVEFVGRILLGQ